ncbi:hypothetical protein [Oceanirhabdus sp. W0125-5]|uniref:hypothetical protein n=1 Tax=Oceanirhabdus sp. W0125-5 TaxID=2999116 RepID=UPI0022F2DDE6|nr:hypothetical protein [Oceanirhabdus sp. W0125-5]WBW99492.1 hypothetical protein OW730_12310 [Oceanirhabdus sp. W0125-5]
MIRSDSLGVTSVIRDLYLEENHYASMMQFFRASSWEVSSLRNQWISIVKSIAPLWKEDDMTIRQWRNTSEQTGSHVVEMIKDGFETAKLMGSQCYF